MNCAYCNREFRQYRPNHKFCSKNCKESFRRTGKPGADIQEQKAREFIKEMLNLNGNVLSIKVGGLK